MLGLKLKIGQKLRLIFRIFSEFNKQKKKNCRIYAFFSSLLGVPMHTLKVLMRHSTIKTTEKFYLKVSDENRKKAVRLLEEMGKE